MTTAHRFLFTPTQSVSDNSSQIQSQSTYSHNLALPDLNQSKTCTQLAFPRGRHTHCKILSNLHFPNLEHLVKGQTAPKREKPTSFSMAARTKCLGKSYTDIAARRNRACSIYAGGKHGSTNQSMDEEVEWKKSKWRTYQFQMFSLPMVLILSQDKMAGVSAVEIMVSVAASGFGVGLTWLLASLR